MQERVRRDGVIRVLPFSGGKTSNWNGSKAINKSKMEQTEVRRLSVVLVEDKNF